MTPGARAQAVELVEAWHERLTVHVPAEQRGLLIIDIDEAIQAAVEAERERVKNIIALASSGIASSFINCDEINAYRLACECIEKAIRQEGDPS